MTTITIHPAVAAELEYLVELHRLHGAGNPMDSVDDLVAFVLASIADGSRRPGSWERGMLESMGLVADGPEHQQYRANYGRPVREDGEPLTGIPDVDNDAGADAELGMAWWNGLTEAERLRWSAEAGNTGRVADAWAAFRAGRSID